MHRNGLDDDLRSLEREVARDATDVGAWLRLEAARARRGDLGGALEARRHQLEDRVKRGIVSKKCLHVAARLGDIRALAVWSKPVRAFDWGDWEQRRAAISNLTHQEMVLFACDVAEGVIQFFTERYPDDDRPRLAIETARKWAADPTE